MPNIHEQKFLNALRDIFVGAKIEGEGGFINLMRIKSRYYSDYVFPRLMDKIDVEIKEFPDFREELFDKLYSFFKRYFSESGSIYFRHTPYYQDIYERIYTDDRDVMMFWKTQNLYYVKTDRLFRSLTVELEEDPKQKFLFDASIVAKTFAFDASTLETKRNNEKRSLIFEYLGKERHEDTLKFTVLYAENGKKTKTSDILKEIKKDGVKITEDQLARAFRLFERQSEVDFFINKNAKAFLSEQFDLWMYQYLFKHESDYSEMRIREMQALKRIAYSVIEFVSQFEDELVRIWNKPKLALSSDYIITLGRLFEISSEVGQKFLEHAGLKLQIEEWKKLGMVEKNFSTNQVFQPEKGILDFENGNKILNSRFEFLPIDTRYFRSLQGVLLSLMDQIDLELDGWLIHSDNYQALNTYRHKFKGKSNCVYLDPPYNTAASEIHYQNRYLHSSWNTLFDNRMEITNDFLSSDAILCVAIDDFELTSAKSILQQRFGDENELSTVVVRSNPHGRAMASGFSQNHEYALFFSKSDEAVVGRLPRDKKQQNRYPHEDELGRFTWMNFRTTGANSRRIDRPKLYYPVYISASGLIRIPEFDWSVDDSEWKPHSKLEKGETIVFPLGANGNERVWNLGWKRARRDTQNEFQAKKVDGQWQIYRKYRPNEEGALPATWWEDAKYSATESGTRTMKLLFGESAEFSYPKSVYLVEDCLRASNARPESIVTDYYAGSGTTAHAVMNLNRQDGGGRKFFIVEVNEYFHSAIVPRIKKVAFSDKWKDGKAEPNGIGMPLFCKYFALEQYEDTLRRAVYLDDREVKAPTFFDNPYESPFSSYVFLRDPKMSDALDTDFDAGKIRVDFEKLYDDIDWAETLSCIKGKFIKSQTADSVTFADGETIKFDEIDYHDILPLIWWDK